MGVRRMEERTAYIEKVLMCSKCGYRLQRKPKKNNNEQSENPISTTSEQNVSTTP